MVWELAERVRRILQHFLEGYVVRMSFRGSCGQVLGETQVRLGFSLCAAPFADHPGVPYDLGQRKVWPEGNDNRDGQTGKVYKTVTQA